MTFVAIPWRSFVSFRQCQSSRILFSEAIEWVQLRCDGGDRGVVRLTAVWSAVRSYGFRFERILGPHYGEQLTDSKSS
jgi:hypothetical protein